MWRFTQTKNFGRVAVKYTFLSYELLAVLKDFIIFETSDWLWQNARKSRVAPANAILALKFMQRSHGRCKMARQRRHFRVCRLILIICGGWSFEVRWTRFWRSTSISFSTWGLGTVYSHVPTVPMDINDIHFLYYQVVCRSPIPLQLQIRLHLVTPLSIMISIHLMKIPYLARATPILGS